MKNTKKIFLALLAMLAVFMFASCSDDEEEEDKSVSMTFTLSDASTSYTVGGAAITTGLYFSNDVTIDGETCKFFFWLDISDTSNLTWMFGLVNDDTETSSILPLMPVYKGYFTEVAPKDTFSRTHYYDYDKDEWVSSTKIAWKTVTTSADGKTFPLTLTESDIAEFEKLFSDEE